jgi:hypothetical protein
MPAKTLATPNDRAAGKPWPIESEAAPHLGVSPRHLWRLIKDGRVRTIKLGARIFIPDCEMKKLEAEGA